MANMLHANIANDFQYLPSSVKSLQLYDTDFYQCAHTTSLISNLPLSLAHLTFLSSSINLFINSLLLFVI